MGSTLLNTFVDLVVPEDDPVQKDAQELCVKQHSMGFTHLMVGSSLGEHGGNSWFPKNRWEVGDI